LSLNADWKDTEAIRNFMTSEWLSTVLLFIYLFCGGKKGNASCTPYYISNTQHNQYRSCLLFAGNLSTGWYTGDFFTIERPRLDQAGRHSLRASKTGETPAYDWRSVAVGNNQTHSNYDEDINILTLAFPKP